MLPRHESVQRVSARQKTAGQFTVASQTPSIDFGANVFNRQVMQTMFPPEVYQNVVRASEGREQIQERFADLIAIAMKEWAVSHGATHYTHWFQPLTGASAEKHDAFIEWSAPDQMIERFSGKQLVQGEPDASSFPSGGLRSTYEARGYTGWDPTSPVFVWKEGNGITLCIPSVFFSWTGDVLDSKIPVHRSEKILSDAVLRLLKLTGLPASLVYATVGLEQEYFVVDRELKNLRPDLLLTGRTLCGAPSPKGQELQDHYFGSVKERVMCFMHAFERAALKLGIPVKTRHNEVAPAQYEVAPIVERATLAIDHNIQLMELMRKIAVNHDLAVLLHEKPFAGLNGSGKHCNWSLATDLGVNLLDPSGGGQNPLCFLILITAILSAVHKHAELLRAAIGSQSNDHRLGGHEAPPAIISVYLGEAIERLLEDVELLGLHTSDHRLGKYDLGVIHLPDLTKDQTDRNRTSPFAFTGTKFEFRALGSSANPAQTVTVLNAIVGEAVNEMMDRIEKKLQGEEGEEALFRVAIPVIQERLKYSRPIRFTGDNYSADWYGEASKRGLPNHANSLFAFSSLKSAQTIKVFKGILEAHELKARYEILCEHYALHLQIEGRVLVDMFSTQVLPTAIEEQKQRGKSLSYVKKGRQQQKELDALVHLIEQGIEVRDALEVVLVEGDAFLSEVKAHYFVEHLMDKMENFRALIDRIETIVDDKKWPLPKYRELLFLV